MGIKGKGSLVEEIIKPRHGCDWKYATCHPIAQDPLLLAYGQRPGYRDLLTPTKRVLRILGHIPPVPLKDLTALMVEQAAIKLRAEGLKENYVTVCMNSMRCFLRYARARGAEMHPFIVEALHDFRLDKMDYAPPVVIATAVIDQFTNHVYKHGTNEDIVLWECLRTGARITEPLMVRAQDVIVDTNTDLVAFRLAVKTKARITRQPKRAIPFIMKLLRGKAPDEFLLRYGNPGSLDASTHDGRQILMRNRSITARNRIYALQMGCFGEVKFRPKNMRSSWISHTVSIKPEAVALVAEHCGNSVATILLHYFKSVGDPLSEFID